MDDIQITILEDGQLSIKTTEISETNHMSADELLTEIFQGMGGEVRQKPVEHEFWKNRDVRRVKGKVRIVRK